MVKTLVLGPLCANCHIVTDENGVGFVVDPGANAWKIFPELEGLDIKYVIFTHEHYDHIMAASEVMEKTGAKLPITTDWEDREGNEEIFEIVVGLTNRAISALCPKDAENNEFFIAVQGNKLFIGGPTSRQPRRVCRISLKPI